MADPQTATSGAPLSLTAKLAQVMNLIKRIPKRGRNDFHGYSYATEADIVEKVRGALAERNVILIPGITAYEIKELPLTKKNEPRDPLTLLSMTFTFKDGDSGEKITRRWVGAGQDGGDKGVYKAMTGAEKYFLLKTFLIPTGDDPEREREIDKAAAKPDRQTKKARPKLPADSHAVYIEKVDFRKRGKVEWSEVTASDGEVYVVQAVKHELITLCTELAQSTDAVVVETMTNAKGKTELVGVRRWTGQAVEAGPAPAPTPPPAPAIAPGLEAVPLTAADIPF